MKVKSVNIKDVTGGTLLFSDITSSGTNSCFLQVEET